MRSYPQIWGLIRGFLLITFLFQKQWINFFQNIKIPIRYDISAKFYWIWLGLSVFFSPLKWVKKHDFWQFCSKFDVFIFECIVLFWPIKKIEEILTWNPPIRKRKSIITNPVIGPFLGWIVYKEFVEFVLSKGSNFCRGRSCQNFFYF